LINTTTILLIGVLHKSYSL